MTAHATLGTPANRGAKSRSDDRPSRVVRNKVDTQERILQAASRLFVTRGFHRTSVARIAEQAGVSPAAVFWHFGTKAALIRDAWKCFLEPVRQSLSHEAERRDSRARLLELCEAYEQFVDANSGAVRALVRCCLESPEMRASLLGELLDLHERFVQEIRASLPAVQGEENQAALAEALTSLLDGNLLLGLLDPRPDHGERRRLGFRVILRLIAPDAEQRR